MAPCLSTPGRTKPGVAVCNAPARRGLSPTKEVERSKQHQLLIAASVKASKKTLAAKSSNHKNHSDG